MNSERRKAILTLTGTLILGILLGMLVPGLLHKVREGGHRGGGRSRESENKGEWFTGTINRIVQPDSAQLKQIRPIAAWASHRIDSLEVSSNQGLADVLDVVKKQLKPIITEEQFKRLDEFDTKARGHWGRREGRH